MARRCVWDCDRCGKQGVDDKSVVQIAIETGRGTDAAGSAYMIQDEIDLCPRCASCVINDLAAPLNVQDGHELSLRIRKKA